MFRARQIHKTGKHIKADKQIREMNHYKSEYSNFLDLKFVTPDDGRIDLNM
jgi:ssDNA-specific exonuclease RecJ